MSGQVLNIKHMVCERCKKAVLEELTGLGFTVESVELGRAVIGQELHEGDHEKIRNILEENGFELIDDKKGALINRIKTIIIDYIHYDREKPEYLNFSDFLTMELGHDYSYLSHLFSTVEGKTIEKYMILQKIEKVKELLVYDEYTLNEISYKLGYSSVQHLSNQFKSITGMTPTHYKNLHENRRRSLDKL